MFSRLNVRTKLLVMLLPAAIGLGALAGLGVQTRLDERGVAQRNRDASALASTASTYVHQLQAERLQATTAAAAGGNDLKSALAVQVGATDNAGDGLAEALKGDSVGSLQGGSTAGDVKDLAESMDRLRDVRTATAAGTASEVDDAYTGVIDATMAAIGRLELADSGGGDGAVSRRWLAEGIEAEWATASAASGLFDIDASAGDSASVADNARELSDRADLFYGNYGDYAGRAETDQLTDARASEAVVESDPFFDELAAPGADASFAADPTTWSDVVSDRMDAVESVEATSYRADVAQLSAAADSADSAAVYFAAGALGISLLVILLAFGISRNISTTLRRLTESAREISQEQVPALVQSLKSGTGAISGLTFTEVDTSSNDEFAEVGAALNDLSRAMVTVATEQQQSLRKGISDIFVNLARRNQTLLDRQIQFIDRLEANEQDPDQLENLFRLDHLATRMRRNAESLLVLAGAEAPRRRARDVELSDVIRVAVGEVEDFARISLMAVEEAEAIGGAAVDVAHLLAELMENGAQYSPPERTVDIVGHRTPDGGYVISITDHGVGMTPERLEAANRLLASPPPVGLALSRALGFVVAGTLANRHGIRVHLTASPSGGVTAEVGLPAALILAVDAPAAAPADAFLPSADEPVGAGAPFGEPVGRPEVEIANVPLTPYEPAATIEPSPIYAAESFSADPYPADFSAASFSGATGSTDQGQTAPVSGWNSNGEYVTEPTPVVSAATPPPYVPVPESAPAPISWGEEFLPQAPAPSKLVDMLPEGPAFEQGLYALLERDVPADPAAPAPVAGDPVAPGSSEPSAGPTGAPSAGLPQRSPGATQQPREEPEIRTAAPQRAPDEVRSVLSRYRSGLVTGRTDGADAPGDGDGPAAGPTDHDIAASAPEQPPLDEPGAYER